MDNLGEKVTGVTGGDKRVCVPCVVTYNLCAPPPDLAGWGLFQLTLLWLFSASKLMDCPYLSVKGRQFSMSEKEETFSELTIEQNQGQRAPFPCPQQ